MAERALFMSYLQVIHYFMDYFSIFEKKFIQLNSEFYDNSNVPPKHFFCFQGSFVFS